MSRYLKNLRNQEDGKLLKVCFLIIYLLLHLAAISLLKDNLVLQLSHSSVEGVHTTHGFGT